MKNQVRISASKNGWIGTIQSLFSSSWALLIIGGLALFLALLAFAGFAIYLAYGFTSNPPTSLSIPSSPSTARIDWFKNQSVAINSENQEGAFMALGVAHASSYPWQMYLWRQTATGSLAEWFGPNLLSIDRFTKRLRLSPLAQQSYDQLPDEHARLLDAYTAGVNSILMEGKQIKQNEITLLKVTPDPWLPWHTLAIERLFAWLSLDIHVLTTDSLGQTLPEWTGILDQDTALKEWLQLHSFKFSVAGTWPATTLSDRTVFHRFVYGSSSIPIFQEASIKINNRPDVQLATIPGTLVLPSGQTTNSSWFVLPSSTATLELQPNSLEATTTHERLKSRDGSEVLLTLQNYPGWLLPLDNQTPLDSLKGLSWKGFNPGSDISGYLNLFLNQTPTFSLLDGNGLITQDSTWSLLGNPPFVHTLKEGIFIGNTSWSSYQASRLNYLLSEPILAEPERWPHDCHNDWAEEQATFLLEEYLLRRISFNEEYSDALTYLRNWDFAYAPSSIGAIIFESWLQELPDTLYTKVVQKELTPSDTLARTYLQQSISSLKDTFGDDLSKWRLDITKPITRNYPAWISDSLFEPAKFDLSKTLFAPLSFPGRGHASTLCWGSFQSNEGYEVSSRWDSWTTTSGVHSTYKWRRHDTSNSFLGRYLIANTPSTTYSFENSQDVIATTWINQNR